MSKIIGLALLGESAIVAQVAAAPEWLQAVRELGSFGLVAFVVWWYATHVAPRAQNEFLAHNKAQREDAIKSISTMTTSYLNALDTARKDYLTGAQTQRADYLAARSEDRAQLNNLSVAVASLTIAMERRSGQVEKEIQAHTK